MQPSHHRCGPTYNSDLKKLEIILPNFPEQQKITLFFTSVDDKIQKLTRKKELLEKYKKGVMQQLFSQQLRFKQDNGSDYPDWEEKRLGEIAKYYDGTHQTPKYVSEGVPFYSVEHVTANQFEVGAEWYFSESSVAAVTVFKKDINDFIFTKTVSREIDGQQINQLRTPENGGSTTIDGIEMQIQHVFDNGFGGYANYTYTDVADAQVDEAVAVTDDDGNIIGATIATRSVSFPNTSKDSFNVGVFYETDLYSARLNYNYRSEYFIAQAEIGDQYRDEQSQLDAQVSWNVTETITLKAEALNLTDEIWENYYVRSSDGKRLGGTQSANGRRFFIGASMKF